MIYEDTIVAVATGNVRAAIGIVRISGTRALEIAGLLTGEADFTHKKVFYCNFYNKNKDLIDKGLLLYFKNPHSYTGEDVVEIQGHGNPIMLNMLVAAAVDYGARIAMPGEFSLRAYQNDKMSLSEAEAVADLINASSDKAAMSALNSLEGDFSKQVNIFIKDLIAIRVFVEANIDFIDEAIDFLESEKIQLRLKTLLEQLNAIMQTAKQGVILNEGLSFMIIGEPNVGKSSLLNLLAGSDKAIVTQEAGTTRDLIEVTINLFGIPINLIDTAGIRQTDNQAERIGIDKVFQKSQQVDKIFFLLDETKKTNLDASLDFKKFLNKEEQKIIATFKNKDENKDIIFVHNKIDLIEDPIKIPNHLYIHTKNYAGLDELLLYLETNLSISQLIFDSNQSVFTARVRHLKALEQSFDFIQIASDNLEKNQDLELVAENLRIAQDYLSQIDGKISSNDLLGEIFSSFCIGK